MTRSLHTLLWAIISVVFLMSPVYEGPLAAATPSAASISSRVWSELEAQGQAEVLIVLRERADLTGADRLSSKEAKGRYVFEALRETARQSQASLVASLSERGIPHQTFYLTNMVSVRADRGLLLELAARPEVDRLEANPRVRVDLPRLTPDSAVDWLQSPGALPWGIERVGAPVVWALGISGAGVVVAGNDTGIFWEHVALKGQYRGWDGLQVDHDANWHDAVNGQPVPYDDHGHGTHTVGTMVGHDGDSVYVGMAPEARWIGCKNMDAHGYGTPARYIECFQFFLAPYPYGGDPIADGNPALAPDVINNSWTCPPSEGCDQDSLREAVEALRAAGIVPVVSAGNYGDGCSTVQYPPATHDASISVGAFRRGDTIATFSSRGPVAADGSGRRKPDLAAPGVSVLSSNVAGGYSSSSGTSVAAPHVAGEVALMLSANPLLKGQVEVIEDLMERSAEPRTAAVACGGEPSGIVPNNTWGWGIIDAPYAVQAALLWPDPMPTPTPTSTTLPPTATPTATPTVTPTPAPVWRVFFTLPLMGAN